MMMFSSKIAWIGPKDHKGTLGIYTDKSDAKKIVDVLTGTNLYKAGYADIEIKECKLSDIEWRMKKPELIPDVKLNMFYHLEILNVKYYDRPADQPSCYETMTVDETIAFYESEQVANGGNVDDKYGGDLMIDENDNYSNIDTDNKNDNECANQNNPE